MVSWNPWHGCKKYSEGCMNCYVYRMDKMYGRNPTEVKPTQNLYLPIKKDRLGNYKYPSGTKFFTCYTSDFFIDDADKYRNICWNIMKERSDCYFMIITKRIDKVLSKLPDGWGYGYHNVEIVCTIENQRQADYRLPIYLNLPIVHKSLCIEPLISPVSIELYLYNSGIEKIISGGESGYGNTIRPCYEEWVTRLYNTSHKYGIPFCFKQTGTNFIHLDGTLEVVARQNQMNRAIELGYQDFRIDSL
jgi:protein gp37